MCCCCLWRLFGFVGDILRRLDVDCFAVVGYADVGSGVVAVVVDADGVVGGAIVAVAAVVVAVA